MTTADRSPANQGALRARLLGIGEVLVFGLVAKGLGFVVPLVLGASYGVTVATDAFFLAFAVAAAIIAVWQQSVEQFAVPLMTAVRGPLVATGRMRWVRHRTLVGAAGTWLAVTALLAWTVSNRGSEFRTLALGSALILLLQVLAAAWGAPHSALLISRSEFRWVTGSLILRAVGVLVAIAAFPRASGILAVAAGYALGELARTLVLVRRSVSVLRTEADVSGDAEPPPGTMGRAGAQLSSMALMGLPPIAERAVAAAIGVGMVSRLEFATKLFYAPAVVFDANLMAVYLAQWSRMVSDRRLDALLADVRRSMGQLLLLSTLVATGVWLLREPLVRILLARGAFPASEIAPVAHLLGILLVALPFSVAGMLGANALVALGENRLIFAVSLMKVAVRSAGAFGLARLVGLDGVAGAFAFAHVLETGIYFVVLPRRIGTHQTRVA